MSDKYKKIVAIGLCAALCLGGAGLAFAQTGSKTETTAPAAESVSSTVAQNISKDETVYVLAGADGSVKKIIVSDWIKNQLGSATVTDKSDLNNIENVKGDESYSVNGDNMKVWDAQGNDIYYQGDIQKELPVGMSVSYTLDGKTISADELAGKSGKVTIRYDYDNRQYETVQINGTNQRIYVPFAMLTGMILDNDCFSNVQVSNGKLVNDGDRTVVAGLAFPGLQENLALSRDQLSIPDYVEVTADVKNFSLGMTVTLACNDVFSQIDDVNFTTADGATASIGKLTDAMTQLLDGSSALYDGLSTLLDKSKELATGVEELAAGAKAIRDGAGSVDEGTAALKAGLAELSTGLNTLSSNSEALNEGAEKVFTTLLSTAATQIRQAGLTVPDLTIDNYAQVLNELITSLDENAVYEKALQQVTAAVEENRPLITEKVTAAVRQQVEEKVTAVVRQQVEVKVTEAVKQQVTATVTDAVKQQVTATVTDAVKQQVTATVTDAVKQQVTATVIQTAAGMSVENYNAAVSAGMVPQEKQDAINAAIQAQMNSEAVQAKIAENITAQMSSEAIQAKITENVTAQMSSDTVKAKITENIDAQMESDTVKAKITENTDAQMESDTVKATIAENTNAQMKTEDIHKTISQQIELQVKKAISENMASDTVQSQLTAASEGAKTLISLKASLDDYNAFYLGLLSYTQGVDTAAAGADQLNSGADQLKEGTAALKEGAATLYNGVLKMKDGVPTLISGVEQLKDGSMQLSEGLQQLNKEGIEKLVSLLENDLGDLSARVQATIDVSKNYRSFAGISDDADGQVKFIYRTDEIG